MLSDFLYLFHVFFFFFFLALSFLWQMNRKNKNYSLHHKSSRNGFRDFLVTNFTIFVNTFVIFLSIISCHRCINAFLTISIFRFLLSAKTTMIKRNLVFFFFFFFHNKKCLFYELAQKLDWNDTVSALISKTCY